jgi:phosphodiesterase/alkaline phosphatase D-like protein
VHEIRPTPLSRLRLTALAALLATSPAWAVPSFLAVAAGDMTADSAIVWTRATDGAGAASGLTLELSTFADFSSIARSVSGLAARDSSYDYTLKVDVSGLDAAQKYYYRFVGAGNSASSVGSFTTTPAAGASTPVHFSFSGDADGLMRPYGLTNNFQQNTPRDFFVFLGDTIYETASTGSAAAAVPTTGVNPTNLSTVLADYQRKYRENLQGVTSAGVPCAAGSLGCGAQQGLSSLYAAQGNYTLLDNHELGNKQYINGGASTDALSLGSNGADPAHASLDVNTTGTYINKSSGYQTFLKAYDSYQPVRETLVSAPADARSDGTQQLYYSRNWGSQLSFTNVDDRSYRDIRLKTANNAADDTPSNSTSGRWANPDRTMLGKTQLSWLESSLSQQQASGQTWKFVAVSSPIDQVGKDGGKSWYGGYQAERNTLLKYIADNNISNVVFLSTDDHFSRVNELWYDDNGTKKRLDNAFTIVTGPLGATGPDLVTNHSFANISALSAAETALLSSENTALNGGMAGNQLGLKDFGGRVSHVLRDQDGTLVAGSASDAVNFFSPDTFAYTNFDIDADGTLHVSVLGIDSSAVNTFSATSATPRVIFSFDVAAAVPEPSEWALFLSGAALLAFRLRRRGA